MTVEQMSEAIRDFIATAPDPFEAVEAIRAAVHGVSPNRTMPVDYVRWIPIEQIQPNAYNPNAVARHELNLLLRSITHDGYTMPIVVIWDPDLAKFVIVDGFHRFHVMRLTPELRERCAGRMPCTVIEKGINDRMASTVRHNRARGKHSVDGMASMVFQMLDQGMDDAAVCTELGMEAEELVRLKHITGFSKLFADHQYNRAWVTRHQVRLKKAQESIVSGPPS